jgi:hypothetical protein
MLARTAYAAPQVDPAIARHGADQGRDSLALRDDVALMRRVAQGCQASFAVLVERHAAALYRVAARMLGDGHDAEDVVQDCFARMWQNAPRWQPTGAGLVGWLHRVAMNLCFDRKRRFRVVVTDDLPDPADRPARRSADRAARSLRPGGGGPGRPAGTLSRGAGLVLLRELLQCTCGPGA